MLSINTIARVEVSTARRSAPSGSFDTGLILAKDTNFSESRRALLYESAAEAAAGLGELGFPAGGGVCRSAEKYFAASPAPARLLVSCYPAAETPAEALAALLDGTADFYGVCLGGAAEDGEILGLDAAVAALDKPAVFFAPVTDPPAAAAAPDGLLDLLYRAGSRRTVPFLCAEAPDAAALMGTAMGLGQYHASGAFSLCYKAVNGAVPSDLTQGQVSAVKAKNGNVYVTRGYTRRLLENGTTASGLRYDEVYYLDRVAADLQEAAAALLAENPDRLPQTDDTTAQFINRFTSVLTRYTERGVLAAAAWRGADTGPLKAGDTVENGFALWADSYDTQPDADRAAHKAMPVHAALCLAGSVESIVMTVNVQV